MEYTFSDSHSHDFRGLSSREPTIHTIVEVDIHTVNQSTPWPSSYHPLDLSTDHTIVCVSIFPSQEPHVRLHWSPFVLGKSDDLTGHCDGTFQRCTLGLLESVIEVSVIPKNGHHNTGWIEWISESYHHDTSSVRLSQRLVFKTGRE